MNVVGDAKRVRFVVEDDLGSGETDYENATPVNVRDLEGGLVVWTCRHFLRFGFLCRRVFCVFNNNDIERIAKKFQALEKA
ncbi:hypothetical protein CTI12_AA048020 [Artemisia annua]|uniref:Uncharacterized protein n=1 Tax=Artemisia annua TaxID=35608 RepID=A0A2U1QCE9_ARTAN|nr:hypothetical protein CTI12_AA048020 [Artemisia annua]